MSLLGLVHALLGLGSFVIGCVLLGLKKGDRRHRLLGWLYLGTLGPGLLAILAQGLRRPAPFHFYGALVTLALAAAVLVVRSARRPEAFRSWHGALMCFSLLGSALAMGGVLGGLWLGQATSGAFYRLFNGIILAGTGAALWPLYRWRALWGRAPAAPQREARRGAVALIATASLALVAAQAVLFR
jgi:uncharacterized membrane protein